MITKFLIWILVTFLNCSKSGFEDMKNSIIEKIIKPRVSSLVFSCIYSILIQEYKNEVVVWINTSKIKSIHPDIPVLIEDKINKSPLWKKEVVIIIDDFRVKSPLQSTYGLYHNYLEAIKKFQ